MNSTIIECKELNNRSVNHGTTDAVTGDFMVDLGRKNIIINENDSIAIRSAFLDTQAQGSGKIVIDDSNKNVSITNFLYFTNLRGATNGFRTINYNDALAGDDVADPDGRLYILCKRHTPALPVGTTLRKLLSVNGEIRRDRGGAKFGGFSVEYQYFDAFGDQQKTTISFPQKNNMDGDINTFGQINGDIVFRSTGNFKEDFKEIGGKDKEKRKKTPYNIRDGELHFKTEASSVGDTFSPVPFTTNFTLEEGNYTPDLLSKTITDNLINVIQYGDGVNNETKLTNRLKNVLVPNTRGGNGVLNVTFPSQSKFLTSTKQLIYDTDYGMGLNANNEPLFFVSHDGKAVCQFLGNHTDPNYLVGASEVSLEFQDDINKFVFKDLHTSIFNSSEDPVVKYFKTSTNSGFLGTSVGGVILNNLSPPELWVDNLGFDSSILCFPDEPKNIPSMGGGNLVNVLVPTFTSLQKGVNLTADLAGIDSAVEKQEFKADANANAQTGSDIVPDIEILSDDQKEGVATLNITQIQAAKPFLETKLTDGYYLIQIDGMPSQDLTNFPNARIQAIVSKFYTNGGFLVMEGEAGSMRYIHKGEPFYLSDIRIKIMEGDGTDPIDLGNNNTIFLEIERGDNYYLEYSY